MNNVATKMQDAVASYATLNWNVDAAIWSAEHEPRVKEMAPIRSGNIPGQPWRGGLTAHLPGD
jgi:hypothetical protein